MVSTLICAPLHRITDFNSKRFGKDAENHKVTLKFEIHFDISEEIARN